MRAALPIRLLPAGALHAMPIRGNRTPVEASDGCGTFDVRRHGRAIANSGPRRMRRRVRCLRPYEPAMLSTTSAPGRRCWWTCYTPDQSASRRSSCSRTPSCRGWRCRALRLLGPANRLGDTSDRATARDLCARSYESVEWLQLYRRPREEYAGGMLRRTCICSTTNEPARPARTCTAELISFLSEHAGLLEQLAAAHVPTSHASEQLLCARWAWSSLGASCARPNRGKWPSLLQFSAASTVKCGTIHIHQQGARHRGDRRAACWRAIWVACEHHQSASARKEPLRSRPGHVAEVLAGMTRKRTHQSVGTANVIRIGPWAGRRGMDGRTRWSSRLNNCSSIPRARKCGHRSFKRRPTPTRPPSTAPIRKANQQRSRPSQRYSVRRSPRCPAPRPPSPAPPRNDRHSRALLGTTSVCSGRRAVPSPFQIGQLQFSPQPCASATEGRRLASAPSRRRPTAIRCTF